MTAQATVEATENDYQIATNQVEKEARPSQSKDMKPKD